ncbi:MAG: hypothetical protein GX409_07345 [candidate division Zixibacteria bacterium]|nr:hypothetical protein [candidate division Zixibacteria bacterium]
MKKTILIIVAFLLIWAALYTTINQGDPPTMPKTKLIFATYVQDKNDFHWAMVMFESIDSFAGQYKAMPRWLYLVDSTPEMESLAVEQQSRYGYQVRKSATPPQATRLFYAGKVYASAIAESEAAGGCDYLAWLDPDIVFVKPPESFDLPENIALGCRPVMLQLIGSSYDQPPDSFWSRLYNLLDVPDSAVFPVTTPVDRAEIRAYFNAGMIIVRPEKGILRGWPTAFEKLYTDSTMMSMVKSDRLKTIFLHQAALAGNILTKLSRAEILELPPTYNYPLNLADRYPADSKPVSLDSLVMFRHDGIFTTAEQLAKVDDGSKILAWLMERLPK